MENKFHYKKSKEYFSKEQHTGGVFLIINQNLEKCQMMCALQWFRLTHTCLEISLTSVVSTGDTLENNLKVSIKFAKYSEESCR